MSAREVLQTQFFERTTMRSKNTSAKPVLARFILINVLPFQLNHKVAREILDFLMPSLIGQHRSLVTIAEKAEADSKPPSDYPEWSYRNVKGRIVFHSLEEVKKVLKRKYADEMEHKRYKGHKSTVAPPYLIPEKLVVVMGSPYFLSYHIELYLERRGVLGDQTFECLRELHRITPWAGSEGGDQDFFLDVDIINKEFYSGNFNAYAESTGLSATRFNMAELMEQLVDDWSTPARPTRVELVFI